MKPKFSLKLITLGVLSAFGATAMAQDSVQAGAQASNTQSSSQSTVAGAGTDSSSTPTSAAVSAPAEEPKSYTQGVGDYATIPANTKVEKTDTAPQPTSAKHAVTGDLNRLGNPVRIIWYGRDKDPDGNTPQKGAINNGQIFGKVTAKGTNSEKNSFNASVQVEGQGNAIDALGWSSYKNKRGVKYILEKIENKGTAQGESELQGALGVVNGDVTGFVSGNGISVVGTADFGKLSRVSGSTAGGVSGSSGATGKSKSTSSGGSSASLSADDAEVTLKDMLVPGNPRNDVYSNPADFKGKDIEIELKSLTNTGSLKGVLTAQAYDHSSDLSASHVADSFQPQFASSTGWSSGNGVSLSTLTDTPDRINISDDRKNTAKLGTVTNNGSIIGEATIKGGTNASHTATYSRSSGNGIAVYAGTGRNAKATTESHIGDITNSGQIIGTLTQLSGKNSGFPSVLQSAVSESYAGGNGISTMTDTANYEVKAAKTKIGDITNDGLISGAATVKSGSQSTGDLSLKSYHTGNGISAYLKSKHADFSIGKITNSGIIKGQIETDPGVATFAEDNKRGAGYYTPAKEEVKLLVFKKGDSVSNPVDVTPPKPAGATSTSTSGSGSFMNSTTESNYTANSEVYSSGNGITLAKHQSSKKQSTNLGDIYNTGVISGQATMYHGYTKHGNYADVKFYNVGAGISVNNSFSSKLDNLGLISGNHAALLAHGTIDTAYSSFNFELKPGYTKDNVKNYGVMAGVLIAGNVSNDGYSSGRNKQASHYFDTENDVITNHGTYVLLKEGITSTGSGWSATSTRNTDAGQIKEVKVANGSTGTGGNGSGNGKSTVKIKVGDNGSEKDYTIINGAVDSAKTDSSYTPTNGAEIKNTIINGVGVAKGALIANQDLTLTDSIINGYKTGLYIDSNKTVTVSGTSINANPFKVNGEATQAVLGTDETNTLIVSGGAVNGDINLKKGNDTLIIKDAKAKINGDVDMGEGEDTVKFGESSSNGSANSDGPITFFGKIKGVEKLEVNAPSKLMPTSSISGVNALTVNSTLHYPVETINGKQVHALKDSATGDLTIDGKSEAKIVIDTDQATTEIDFGAAKLKHKNGNGNAPQLSVSNVLQTATIVDGKISIKSKEAAKVDNTNVNANDSTSTNANGGQADAPSNSSGGSNSNTSASQAVVPSVSPSNSSGGSNPNVSSQISFETPYVDAYNAYINAWKNGGTNFLKQSGRTDNKKDEQQAHQAINAYLGKMVEQNIYGVLPEATLDGTRWYGQTVLDSGWLLPVGDIEVDAQVHFQSRPYKQAVNKVNHTYTALKASYGVRDNLTVGMALGVLDNRLDGSDGSHLSGKGLYAGSYVVSDIAHANVRAGVSYYRADLQGNRSIANGYDNHKFDVNTNTAAATIYVQGKYDIPLGNQFALSPKLGIMAHQFHFGGVKEQGAAGLMIDNSKQNVVDTTVGVELTANKVLSVGVLSAKVSADYTNTSGLQTIVATLHHGGSFRSDGSFAVQGGQSNQKVYIGGKIGYQLNDKATINAHIGSDIRSLGNALQGGISANYRF